MNSSSRRNNLFLLFLLAFFLFFIWIRFVETSRIKVEPVFIKVANFPSKSLKVAHLTDLHSFGYGEKERRVVELVDEIDPDLLLITGDIVDWRTDKVEECLPFWRELVSGREGRVFAVWGNHEHKNPRFKKIQETVARSGIRVLVNENQNIEWGRSSFYLAGVDDPRLGYDDSEQSMAGLDEETPTIVLAHSPVILRKIKHYKPDLVLAGHTHGCQVNIPVLCDWLIPLAYDKQYKQGLFEKDGVQMYVSRGIGETFIPVRFNCPPEIAVINIRAQ